MTASAAAPLLTGDVLLNVCRSFFTRLTLGWVHVEASYQTVCYEIAVRYFLRVNMIIFITFVDVKYI